MNTQWMDASHLAQAIRQGEMTSTQAVTQSLEQIQKWDGSLHAFVSTFNDNALAIAAVRDAEQRAGHLRGALHGVPIAIKDLFDIAGYPTQAGSKSLPPVLAKQTAHAVARLEAAGAVVIGKAHTVEFAFGGWGTNPVLGAPRNPYDLNVHRVSGGSSSGSAVAVASNMVALALGTDTGGSIRMPSALCGVYGHKSSTGLIGRSGLKLLSNTHDSIGTIARSVRDLILTLPILAEFDFNDPSYTPQLTLLRQVQQLGKPLYNATTRPFRLATLEDEALDVLQADIRQMFESSLRQLEQWYGPITRLRLPAPLAKLTEQAGLLMSAEAYSTLHTLTEDEASPIAPVIRARVNKGREISAKQLIAIYQQRQQWQRQWQSSFAPYDALVMPGMPVTACPLDAVDENSLLLALFGRFVNMLDLSSVAVPIAQSKEGLPMGLQLIAAHNHDHIALELAFALEQRGMSRFLPPVGLSSEESRAGI